MHLSESQQEHVRMLALTCSSCGIQVIWSILMSNVTPFLLSVGFSDATCGLVWSIAPFCGTFLQPWFGALSDRHRHPRYGRKLFLVWGSVATSVSLIGFALARDEVQAAAKILQQADSDDSTRSVSMATSIFWFALLNISVQPLQVANRTFIIENCDTDEQISASAWASRMQGVGSILGFILGSMPLRTVTGDHTLGDFSTLSIIGAFTLLLTTYISCRYVQQEQVPSASLFSPAQALGKSHLHGLVSCVRTAPAALWQVCAVQFFAWLGWFPFRTYYTQLFVTFTSRQSLPVGASPDSTTPQVNTNQLGSETGILLSVVAFIANIVLPWLATFLHTRSRHGSAAGARKSQQPPIQAMLHIWLASHLYMGFAMFISGLVSSQLGAVMLFASIGVSWAVSLWVPYSLIGILLSKMNEHQSNQSSLRSDDGAQAGAVMGFHNAAISAPQIISALVCSFVYAKTGDDAQGTLLVFLFGGCWALVAAYVLTLVLDDLIQI